MSKILRLKQTEQQTNIRPISSTKEGVLQDRRLPTYSIDPKPKPTHVVNVNTPKPQSAQHVVNANTPKPQSAQKEPVKKINKVLQNKLAVLSKNKEPIKEPIKEEETIESIKPNNTQNESKNPQLKELHYIKNGFGKKIIAKYRTKNNNRGILEDNLIIAWGGIENPQVLSYKVKGPGIFALADDVQPHQKRTFRVHDFTKFSPKVLKSKKKKSNKKKKETKEKKCFKTEYSDD